MVVPQNQLKTLQDDLKCLIEEAKIRYGVDEVGLAEKLGISRRTLSKYKNDPTLMQIGTVWLLENMVGRKRKSYLS